jgi:CelD/BcsL family acetyltransferase involved in cellulose biosynthesis
MRAVLWQSMAGSGAEWEALAASASEPNPFFESWYLLPGLQAFDPDGQVQLLRFEVDGILAGLLPVARKSRYYGKPVPNLASWLHANCFLGAPLVARGRERRFWQALLQWADGNAGGALFLHLDQMPLEGPLYQALVDELVAQNRLAGLVQKEERALLVSEASPEDYFAASMSGKKRKELRRQQNRLAELGTVEFVRQTDEVDLERWIEHFLTLEAGGWKGKAGSALSLSSATATLFRAALQGAARCGKLERLSLTLNDQPIAMLATFLTPPGAFSFKTAFNEEYARFSPGVLLQAENLKILGHPQVRWTDSCASADHPMIDHIWRERRPIGRISIAIGGMTRRLLFRGLLTAELGRKPKGLEV